MTHPLLIKIAYFFLDLIAPLAVGYLLRKGNLLSQHMSDYLIKLALLIVYPLLTVISFWKIRISPQLLWLPFFGVILHIVPGLLASLNVKKIYAAPADRGSYLLSAILSNQMVVGGIAVFILYGELGFNYVQLTVLLQGVILFLVCFPLAQYYQRCQGNDESTSSLSWRAYILNKNQVGILGLVLGTLLNLSGWQRPAVATQLFGLLVHINAWTTLIPVGHSIRFRDVRWNSAGARSIVAIKFFLKPAIIITLSALLLNDLLMRNTILVLAFSPSAISAVITVRLFKLSVPTVITDFVVTNVLYLVLIYPTLFVFLQYYR